MELLLFIISFPILRSPVLVGQLDEPVEHHHVWVDLPGEHEQLVRVRRVVTRVTRVMTALHTGCQLDQPWGYIIVTPARPTRHKYHKEFMLPGLVSLSWALGEDFAEL